MNNGFTRRQFLAASMAACLTALVGCGSGSRAESDGSTSASSASSAASPSPSSSAVSSSSAASVEAADPQAEDGSKALIVYFSYTGHLDTMAHWIADETGGDLVRVTAVDAYPDDYDATVDRAKAEQDDGARPEINVDLTQAQLNGYDTVFVGFPVWWYDLPMPMWTFLEGNDFSGKTVIPFFSHEGSSNGANALPNLETFAKGATVRSQDALSIHGDDVDASEGTVRAWVKELGYSK